MPGPTSSTVSVGRSRDFSMLDVTTAGIGETPNDLARGATAILLLNQAAAQAIIV